MGGGDIDGVWSMLEHAMLRAHHVGDHDIVKLCPAGAQYPHDAGPPDEDVAKRHWKTAEHGESSCPLHNKGATPADPVRLLS
jgi:hypothetical protein